MHKPIPTELARYDAVGLGYGDTIVFDALDLTLSAGKVTVFCGPNGCGKSTSLKALRRLLRPQSGNIFLNGESIATFSTKRLARQIAMLTQSPLAPEELLVEQLIELGRYAHRRRFAGISPADRQAIDDAMAACQLEDLRHRPLGALSGGQLQRAWLATVLAQDSPVILLDEPTSHLDLKHQIETLELIRHLNATQNKTIVLVLHDINLAARYADEMVMFHHGQVFTQGAPDTVMTEAILSEVFAIGCRVIADPVDNKPICIPYPDASPQER